MRAIANNRLTVSSGDHHGSSGVGGSAAAASPSAKAATRRPSEFKRELISTFLGGGRATPLSNKTQNEGAAGVIMSKTSTTTKYSINRQGGFYLFWMGIVSFGLLYNAIVIPLRSTFTQIQGTMYSPPGQLKGPPTVVTPWKPVVWFCVDLLFDLLYLLDILLVQWRVGIQDDTVNENSNNEGKEGDSKGSKNKLPKAARQYIYHWYFWLDAAAVFPYELLYAIPFLRFNPLVRLPRLLKVRHLRFFMNHFENYTDYPHIFSYIRCFHFAFLIVSTIRSQESNQPTNNVEYLIELFGSLIGVFFMAVIISNISVAVVATNHKKLLMHKKRDMLREYLQRRKIPKKLEKRVEMWLEYAFTQRNVLNDRDALSVLPFKMRSDLVIHGMLDTLSKVRIFQGFPNSLLRELVLRLKPTLYIPGDCICLKGEIGREMYIVNQGLAVVVGGANADTVLTELGPGSMFGEISLLSVRGGNRRTATVISKGFTHLFVLSNKDLRETISDYPEAKTELLHKANHLLKRDKIRNEVASGTSFEDFCSGTGLDEHHFEKKFSFNKNDICYVNNSFKENDDNDAWKTEFFPFGKSNDICFNPTSSSNNRSVCRVAWS